MLKYFSTGHRGSLLFWIIVISFVSLYCNQIIFAKNLLGNPKKNKIVMGGDLNFPPSTFIKDGQPSGFQVDVIKAVAAVGGLDVEFSFSPWKEALERLRTGEIDVVAMSYSRQREEDFDFTVQYALNAFGLLARENSDINSIFDVKGKKILVQKGGVMSDFIETNKIDAEITFIKDVKTIVQSLSAGSYDGALLSKKTALYVIKQLGISGLRFTDESIAPKRTVFGVTKGNYELVQLLNEGLAVINANGQLKEINEKWFGTVNNGLLDPALVKKWALRAGILVFVIVAVIFLWNRRLNVEISKRKRIEEALRESEERFRNVYRTAPLGFVIWDNETRITDWNKKAEEVFGWSKKEVIGKNFFRFLVPEKDRPIVKGVVDNLMQDKILGHSINNNLTKCGKVIICEWYNSALHDHEGKIIGGMSLGHDITEEKLAEAEREKIIGQLKKALSEIKTLRGFLPICSSCKKIRDDEGYWNLIESYVEEHSEASFSHSMCPECSEKFYSNEEWYIKMKKKKENK